MSEMYENIWEWEGRTAQSSDTSGRTIGGPITDPFPKDQVIESCKIAILAETTAKFQEEMGKIGITTSVSKIEPEVWIETKTETREYRDYTLYTWHHWLHMKAKVYFTSDKPLTASPIDPATVTILVGILKYVIEVIAVALVIYGIVSAFINSFFIETQTVTTTTTTVDPVTGETTTTTTKETVTRPAWYADIGTLIVVLIIALFLIWMLTRGKKRR